MALLNSKPRNATIECIENSLFAIVDKEDYNSVLSKAVKKRVQEKVKFLQTYRLFHNVSVMKLQKALYFLKEMKFVRNQIIFKEGEPIDGVYIIIEGEFEYLKAIPNLDKDKSKSQWIYKALSIDKVPLVEYQRKSIAIIQSGDILGFEELYENHYIH